MTTNRPTVNAKFLVSIYANERRVIQPICDRRVLELSKGVYTLFGLDAGMMPEETFYVGKNGAVEVYHTDNSNGDKAEAQAPQEARTDLELANFLLDNAKDYCTTKDGRLLINFHDKGVWRMIPGGETWAERETLVMHLLPKHRIIYATIAQAYEWLQTSEKFTYCIDALEISAHAATADFLVNKLEDRFLELLKLDGE